MYLSNRHIFFEDCFYLRIAQKKFFCDSWQSVEEAPEKIKTAHPMKGDIVNIALMGVCEILNKKYSRTQLSLNYSLMNVAVQRKYFNGEIQETGKDGITYGKSSRRNGKQCFSGLIQSRVALVLLAQF